MDEKLRAGQEVILNETPLYRTSDYPASHRKLSGKYFLYDGKEANQRLKIVSSRKSVKYKPESMVFIGWVSKKDIMSQHKQ